MPKKKKKAKPCIEARCRNMAANGRRCNTCASRHWRAANPMKAAYIRQKSHAKERKIPFNLSFEDFERFAIEEKLIGHTGTTKHAYQIDRINEDSPLGYHIDNIQKLTQEENVAKEHARRKRKKQLDFDWQYPEHTSWIKKEEIDLPDTPF